MLRFQKNQKEAVGSAPLSGAVQKGYQGNWINCFCIASFSSFSLQVAKLFHFLLWGIRKISQQKMSNIKDNSDSSE